MLGYVCVFNGGRVSGQQSILELPHLTSEHLNLSTPLGMGYFSTIQIDFDVVTLKKSTSVQSEPDMTKQRVTNSLNN
jgi:hypothetical protein